MKKKLMALKKSQKKAGIIKPPQIKKREYIPNIPKLLLGVFIIVSLGVIYFILASHSAEWIEYSVPDLSEGEISTHQVIAPFEFHVPKPERELEAERNIAARNMLPVFVHDKNVFDIVNARIDTLFSIVNSLSTINVSDSLGRTLTNDFSQELSFTQIDSLLQIIKKGNRQLAGIINKATKESFLSISEFLIVSDANQVANISNGMFTIDNGDTLSVSTTIGVDEAKKTFINIFQNEIGNIVSKSDLITLQNIMLRFLNPNLAYNNQLTTDLRNKAIESVPIYSASYKENERIIDANVLVEKSHIDALDALKKELQRRSFIEKRINHYAMALGKTVIAITIIGIVFGFIYLYKRKIYESFSKLLLIVLISSIPITVAFYLGLSGNVMEFLVPVAFASILITILFDAELGIIISLGISLIVSTIDSSTGMRMGIVYFISATIGGVFTVGHVRHRREFYKSIIFIPLAMAVTIAATNNWVANSSLKDVGFDIFLGALNGFLCPIFAIGFLPLLESLFKVTTDITLLELSDLNNPLLRELAVKAPGTYSSVLVVGTLAEAAAEKVGANPLLCRVGAYYHDIGKIGNPEYFIENQKGGINPHDRLSPHMSALILASHVKEGYELGEKNGLPDAVLDIIKQHHGTSLMASIYQKAKETGEKPLDDLAFRYPGPKPQTREAAIVMLADLSEAASRSVKEKSPGRLTTLINTIIQQRFIDGELNECDLTLKNLHLISEAFLPFLVGSYHERIEYPWQKSKNDQRKKPENNRNSKNTVKENKNIDRNGDNYQ
ncbi:HD family phosphohydrolase [Candidatus Latescibacterota bacterium]